MDMNARRSEPLNDAEIALVRKGRHIPAIKEYNVRTNAGLRASMDAVIAWAEINGYREEGVCSSCAGTGRARIWKDHS